MVKRNKTRSRGFANNDSKASTRTESRISTNQTRKLKKKYKAITVVKKDPNWKWSIEVECQLYRGEDKYPTTKTMTNREVVDENIRLAKVYMAKVEKEPGTRMWSWKPIKQEE